MAWKKGVKSLYYCCSLSIARANNVSEKAVALVAFEGMAGNGGGRWAGVDAVGGRRRWGDADGL